VGNRPSGPGHRTAEEARDLVERIGLGALREDVEALLRELEAA